LSHGYWSHGKRSRLERRWTSAQAQPRQCHEPNDGDGSDDICSGTLLAVVAVLLVNAGSPRV
jgi:hypothetical protein